MYYIRKKKHQYFSKNNFSLLCLFAFHARENFLIYSVWSIGAVYAGGQKKLSSRRALLSIPSPPLEGEVGKGLGCQLLFSLFLPEASTETLGENLAVTIFSRIGGNIGGSGKHLHGDYLETFQLRGKICLFHNCI